MSEYTTIKISKLTRDKLNAVGSKKDTYDDIINRQLEPVQEATITAEGRISKSLAGKTITYKIKQP